MRTLLVTVAYGGRRRDLAVRADVPIADLLGPLAEALAAGAHPGGAARRVTPDSEARPGDNPVARPGDNPVKGLALAPLCGRPLPAERSLEVCGVGHGAVLALISVRPGAPPP